MIYEIKCHDLTCGKVILTQYGNKQYCGSQREYGSCAHKRLLVTAKANSARIGQMLKDKPKRKKPRKFHDDIHCDSYSYFDAGGNSF